MTPEHRIIKLIDFKLAIQATRACCWRASALILCAMLSACATPAGQVQRWQISGVEVAEFSGEVVDILCQISGNCADKCGAGSRQLGLKTPTQTVLVAKDLNRYTGASEELWPLCGQQLTINGQFTQSGANRFFQVQNVRVPGGPWMSTAKFLQNWAQQNDTPVSEAANWYRKDKRIEAILEQDGLLGLGADADP